MTFGKSWIIENGNNKNYIITVHTLPSNKMENTDMKTTKVDDIKKLDYDENRESVGTKNPPIEEENNAANNIEV